MCKQVPLLFAYLFIYREVHHPVSSSFHCIMKSDSDDQNAVSSLTLSPDKLLLQDIVDALKHNVPIMDRTYHFKTYKQCFIGSEAIDYLVSSGVATSRNDALQIGQLIMNELHTIEHVTRDHPLLDDKKFYRFVQPNERGGTLLSTTNKEEVTTEPTAVAVSWSDFVSPTVLHNNNKSSNNDSNMDDLVERYDQITLDPSLLPKNTNLNLFDAISPKDIHVATNIWPLDKYNTELLNNVHPPNWQDPIVTGTNSNNHYDMVVIGGGTAGLITAAGSAGVGARVAMIEEHLLGGDCLNVGCVPSKTLIHSANLAHTLRGNVQRLNNAGITLDPSTVQVDFTKVMERVRKVRSEISHHDSAERYSKELGVEIFIGRGKFTSENSVIVNGQTLTFKRAAIATGGYPTLIAMEGLEELYKQCSYTNSPTAPRPIVITNETIFNLTMAPKKLIVIGAGVIGLEMAQAMQRLGVPTTVLGRSGRVLNNEDEDLALIVKEQMVSDGVEFRLNVTKYCKIELTGVVHEENGHPEMKITIQEDGIEQVTEIICDALLIAAGRRPNVTGMDLELAKVQYDTQSGLVVNDKLQTTNSRIYGVGDCCSKYKFTHAADFMARAVIRNALFLGKEKMSSLLIPYATFTSPEIASVGLYESDLKEKGIEYRIIEKHFKDNDRSITDDATQGMVRIRVGSKTDQIYGATIVGNNAGNMISEITLAMQTKTGLGSIAAVIHPYPTAAEAIRHCGDLYNKTRLTTTVKTLLRGIIQIQR
jgi:pyruvate/2-oxoglutarate dehydrogenase complex dihydrolipoamide dehydrogenase (E3) component